MSNMEDKEEEKQKKNEEETKHTVSKTPKKKEETEQEYEVQDYVKPKIVYANNVEDRRENKGDNKNNIVLTVITTSLISSLIGSSLMYAFMSGNMSNSGTNNTSTKTYKIESVENPVVAIAENVSSSVVGIKVKTTAQTFFGQMQDSEAEGSGIIYSKDGYVITNYHLFEGMSDDQKNSANIEVYLAEDSETSYEAKIIGVDQVTDLAVIKIEAKDKKLDAATFGKSKDLKVGELAVAIGNPLGLDFAGTVTGGYISGLDRKISTDGRTYSLIQTDAAINSGNSGGALVNAKGEIIGINTAKIGATGVEGLGFAIPIDTAKPIVEQLIKDGKVKRPYIGIGGVDITEQVAKKYSYPQGIYVQTIEETSPAAIAGLERGDIITKADGKDVKTMEKLNEIKYNKNIGDKLELVVTRGKEEVTLTVVLGEE